MHRNPGMNYSNAQVNLKALDGIQGPLYDGTGCFFSRKALYGYDPPSQSKSWWGSVKKSLSNYCGHSSSAHVIDETSSSLFSEELNMLEREFPSSFHCMEKCFGRSPHFIASDLIHDDSHFWRASPDEILREAIQVISCDYEDSTAWGREVGWIYGCQTGDILTGFKMHARGWRSVYCMPACAAFRGSAPINLSDRLAQITYQAFIWIMLILISALANWALEARWSGVSLQELWINQQFWAIAGVSSHFFAFFQGLGRAVRGLGTSSKVTEKTFSKDNAMEFCWFNWTSLLVLPTTLLLINLWAMVAGITSALTSGYYASLSVLFAELFFASGVIFHLHPFLKAFSASEHKIPTVVILWSLLLAAMFSVLWVRLNPFTTRFRGPDIKDCGIEC